MEEPLWKSGQDRISATLHIQFRGVPNERDITTNIHNCVADSAGLYCLAAEKSEEKPGRK